MSDKNGEEVQYWDKVVFISFLTEKDECRTEAFRALLRNIEMPLADARLILSAYVVAEVHPSNSYNKDHQEILHDMFMTDRNYVQFYAVTRRIAFRAVELTRDYSVSNADAVHLATASEARVDVFYTYDGNRQNKRSGELLRLNGLLSNPGDPPPRIVTPNQDLLTLWNLPSLQPPS